MHGLKQNLNQKVNKTTLFTDGLEEFKRKKDMLNVKIFEKKVQKTKDTSEELLIPFDFSEDKDLSALKSLVNDLYKIQRKRN